MTIDIRLAHKAVAVASCRYCTFAIAACGHDEILTLRRKARKHAEQPDHVVDLREEQHRVLSAGTQRAE
jgi:hypothetical protein